MRKRMKDNLMLHASLLATSGYGLFLAKGTGVLREGANLRRAGVDRNVTAGYRPAVIINELPIDWVCRAARYIYIYIYIYIIYIYISGREQRQPDCSYNFRAIGGL